MGAAAPASAREALDMVRAGLGYLAAADATQLPAAVQAECLRELEQHDAMATAARAGFLAAFTAGQGPAGDGDYSAVSWLIHRTGITKGAAVGHSAWAKRVATHPRVLAALGAGQVPESAGRVICLWTDKLPQEYRDAGDEQLLDAFAGGLGLSDLAGLFAEMYVRTRGDLPDQDRGREFADREVKLATTIGGAGVLHGDLTAECAAAVAAVLDALGGKAGKEDDRTKGQRYHDALAEAMGAGSASKNRPSRPKSVASKAAMLAPSSRPTRCRRSGSRAVRMMSAPLARASRAVSSPMPELPPMTRTVCPSRSCSRCTGEELIEAAMVPPGRRRRSRRQFRPGLLRCHVRGVPAGPVSRRAGCVRNHPCASTSCIAPGRHPGAAPGPAGFRRPGHRCTLG